MDNLNSDYAVNKNITDICTKFNIKDIKDERK